MPGLTHAWLDQLEAAIAASNQAGDARRYYSDPAGFARDCIDWRGSDGLTAYQDEVLAALPQHHRVAVRGPHGLGKSTLAAVVVLWFATTRDAAGVDWKIVTTAGAWRQLIHYLWPEVHKWAGRLRHERIGRDRPFTSHELLTLLLRLDHGEAFAAAATRPELIEGAHADSLLFIYDESKAITAATFDACEGAFSGTGESFALALSTPGQPNGRFYDIHSRRPGYEDWWARHVTLDDAIKAGRISKDWAGQRERQWGRDSALFQNRVLGEFHAGDEDSVIPLAWVEAAVERWRDWDAKGRPEPHGARVVGVDVARFGSDRTVLAVRQGDVIQELHVSSKADTMQTTGKVVGLLQGWPHASAVVDVIGIGAGVVDRLREQGYTVTAFNAGAKTKRRDRVGQLGFANRRAAAWWSLREQLDPSTDPDIALPDDDQLLGDLTAPHWREMSGGKIAIESKDDLRERIGRSTDHADAVIQAFEIPSPTGNVTAAVPWGARRGAVPWGGDDNTPAAIAWR